MKILSGMVTATFSPLSTLAVVLLAASRDEGMSWHCSVCGEEEETNLNHLLQCDGCRGFVHMACYGVPSPPEGRLWLCDLCKLGAPRLLCPGCRACAHMFL